MLDYAKSTWRNISPLLFKKKKHPSAPYHQRASLSISDRIFWSLARKKIERGDEYKRLGFSYLCEYKEYLDEDMCMKLLTCHDQLGEKRKQLLSTSTNGIYPQDELYLIARKYKRDARDFYRDVKNAIQHFQPQFLKNHVPLADSPEICVSEVPSLPRASNVMVNVACGKVYSCSGSSFVSNDSFNMLGTSVSSGSEALHDSAEGTQAKLSASPSPRSSGQYRYQRGQPFLTVNVVQPPPSLCGSSVPSTPRGSCYSCPATPSTANFDRDEIRLPIWVNDATDEGVLDQTTAWSELRPDKKDEPRTQAEETHKEQLPSGPDVDDKAAVTVSLPDNNAENTKAARSPKPCAPPVSPDSTSHAFPSMCTKMNQDTPSQVTYNVGLQRSDHLADSSVWMISPHETGFDVPEPLPADLFPNSAPVPSLPWTTDNSILASSPYSATQQVPQTRQEVLHSIQQLLQSLGMESDWRTYSATLNHLPDDAILFVARSLGIRAGELPNPLSDLSHGLNILRGYHEQLAPVIPYNADQLDPAVPVQKAVTHHDVLPQIGFAPPQHSLAQASNASQTANPGMNSRTDGSYELTFNNNNSPIRGEERDQVYSTPLRQSYIDIITYNLTGFLAREYEPMLMALSIIDVYDIKQTFCERGAEAGYQALQEYHQLWTRGFLPAPGEPQFSQMYSSPVSTTFPVQYIPDQAGISNLQPAQQPSTYLPSEPFVDQIPTPYRQAIYQDLVGHGHNAYDNAPTIYPTGLVQPQYDTLDQQQAMNIAHWISGTKYAASPPDPKLFEPGPQNIEANSLQLDTSAYVGYPLSSPPVRPSVCSPRALSGLGIGLPPIFGTSARL